MKHPIPKPSCVACPHNYSHSTNSVRQRGVMMHFGERFCLKEKRARRFKKSDPKIAVPQWCPRRKSPRELRIYRLKDIESRVLHDLCNRSVGAKAAPMAHRYALAQTLTTEFTAKEFSDRVQYETDSDLLGQWLSDYSVIEFDDGLMPICFYKVDGVWRYEPFLDMAKARENKMEEVD